MTMDDLTRAEQEVLLSTIAGCPVDAGAQVDLVLLEKRLVRFDDQTLVATPLGMDVAGRRPAGLYATGGVLKSGWNLVDEGCTLVVPEKRTDEKPAADSR